MKGEPFALGFTETFPQPLVKQKRTETGVQMNEFPACSALIEVVGQIQIQCVVAAV